ncbi:MAG: hypothetical protein ACYTF7_08740 [Planctomycetota bacterium]
MSLIQRQKTLIDIILVGVAVALLAIYLLCQFVFSWVDTCPRWMLFVCVPICVLEFIGNIWDFLKIIGRGFKKIALVVTGAEDSSAPSD